MKIKKGIPLIDQHNINGFWGNKFGGSFIPETLKKPIEDLTKEILVGDIYTGKVVRLMNFGAFVQILPGKDGLVHISQLSDRRVESVESEVEIGQQRTVVVTQIDEQGRINLSRRALLDEEDDRTLEEKIESGDFIPARPQRSGDRGGRGGRNNYRGGDRGGRGGRNNNRGGGGDRGGRGGFRSRDRNDG